MTDPKCGEYLSLVGGTSEKERLVHATSASTYRSLSHRSLRSTCGMQLLFSAEKKRLAAVQVYDGEEMNEPGEPPPSPFLIQEAVFPSDDDYTLGCMNTELLQILHS